MAVYVVRTSDDAGITIPGVFEELQEGRARIGWSSNDNQDLRVIHQAHTNGLPLDNDQKSAVRSLQFYRDVSINDYLIYPNQPQERWFTVVQVTGDYDYSAQRDGINDDFRSYRPCEILTNDGIDNYDDVVPAQLRYRLGVQGRISRVHNPDAFDTFMAHLPQAGKENIQNDAIAIPLGRIHDDLYASLPTLILREFARADLSRRFCMELFQRMGYSCELQEGPAEAGSDIVVSISDVLLPDQNRVGVQVFGYLGQVSNDAFMDKLNQLLNGWEENGLNSGVLITTAYEEDNFQELQTLISNHNHSNPNRPIKLIGGMELASLFLQYFSPLS